MLSFFSPLYILDNNPSPDEQLAKIFSHSVCYLLILVIVSFDVEKLSSSMQFHLSILAIISWETGVIFRKLFPVPICF
jgi:hypothetical protein